MVSTAFGLEDPGSNPGWFAVPNYIENWVILTWSIQAFDQATPILITVTVSSLVGGDK